MKQYFFIHAAWQSGKTVYLPDLTRRLNEGGKYFALFSELLTWDELKCRDFIDSPQISTWIYGICLVYGFANFTDRLVASLMSQRI